MGQGGRRIAAVTALVAVLASATVALPARAVAGAPEPHVDGAQLRDARTGETWVPHGASVPSLEYACVQGWTPDSSNFSLASAQAMADSVLDWACWIDGGCQLSTKNQDAPPATGDPKFPAVGMADLLAVVRAAGAEQPVLLTGMAYGNDLSHWLTRTAGIRAEDDQLIAAWHNYRGQGCTTSCASMYATAEAVAAVVPLLITEFGYEPTAPAWFESVMDWADAHGVGFLPWAWWDPADYSGHYRLYDGAAFTAWPGEGTAFAEHLAGLAAPDDPGAPDPPVLPGRIAGPDRYATAAEVARVWDGFFDGTVAFVATGENYPDALSAAAAAAAWGAPLLLTSKDSLPKVVKSRLDVLRPDTIIVLGSTDAVSTKVVHQLEGVVGSPRVERWAGSDRYATGREIVRRAWHVDGDGDADEGISLHTVVIATGRNFPDALAGAALAGALDAPLVIAKESCVPSPVRSAVASLGPASRVLLGSSASLDNPVAALKVC